MTDHHHRHDAAERPLPPTPTDAERIALAAAKEASRQTIAELFNTFGINITNMDEASEFRKDVQWIRRMRVGSSRAGSTFFFTFISAIAGAFAIGVWELAKGFFHIHVGH
jgi:alkanesulfonate monooxygenase SsuD/methylene tetrahydromethanopterin reductase-like flavin-dependent oxidoreductase (luciferase family)